MEFLLCTIEFLQEICENISMNTMRDLEASERITMDAINRLNNQQISHWSELTFRDRHSFVMNAIEGHTQDEDVTIRLQHFNSDDNSSRRHRHRLISERLENLGLYRSLTLNSRIPSQLARCSERAPAILERLQDSVD
jgi:uncharacterized protein (DUF1786 family)